jgi:hypothetical protein
MPACDTSTSTAARGGLGVRLRQHIRAACGWQDPKQLGKYSCPLPFPTQTDCPFALYKGFAGDTLPKPAGDYEREYIALAHTMIASSSCGCH